jgi:hypothetical protein
MIKAVIDRFEAEYAILIVVETDQRLNLLRTRLPKRAKEGTWLQLENLDDQITTITLDPQSTALARQRIADKLTALRRGDHLK